MKYFLHSNPIYTGLFEMIVEVVTVGHTQYS